MAENIVRPFDRQRAILLAWTGAAGKHCGTYRITRGQASERRQPSIDGFVGDDIGGHHRDEGHGERFARTVHPRASEPAMPACLVIRGNHHDFPVVSRIAADPPILQHLTGEHVRGIHLGQCNQPVSLLFGPRHARNRALFRHHGTRLPPAGRKLRIYAPDAPKLRIDRGCGTGRRPEYVATKPATV